MMTPDELGLVAVVAGVIRARESPDLQITDFDRENVGHAMQAGTNWSAQMLRLIAKSDPAHRAAIRLVFPSHVEAYEKWFTTPEGTDA